MNVPGPLMRVSGIFLHMIIFGRIIRKAETMH